MDIGFRSGRHHLTTLTGRTLPNLGDFKAYQMVIPRRFQNSTFDFISCHGINHLVTIMRSATKQKVARKAAQNQRMGDHRSLNNDGLPLTNVESPSNPGMRWQRLDDDNTRELGSRPVSQMHIFVLPVREDRNGRYHKITIYLAAD